MSQGWSKLFSRINWFNRPIKTTSLGATNLNKNDYALDKIDDRVIALDTIKADMNVVNGMVSDVSLDNTTGILTITYKDGSEKTYNTNLQKIAVNFRFDKETQRLVLVLPDGTEQYVDLSAFITDYEFADSSTIVFSVDESGKVSASIKNGSITESMLETGYLANIKVEVAKAEAAATQAQSSETSSDYNAKLSRSYAIGGSGIRDGEDTDNAMYYYEQAKKTDVGQIRSEVAELSSNLDGLGYGENSGSANIFNGKIVGGLLIETGEVSDWSARITSDFIPVEPNTLYTQIAPTSAKGGRYCEYDANKNLVYFDPSGLQDTLTTKPTTKYLRISFGSGYGTTFKNDIAIIKGNATEYVPYIMSNKQLGALNDSLEGQGLLNKFDGELLQGAYVSSNGSYDSTIATSVCTKNKIDVVAGDRISAMCNNKVVLYTNFRFYKTDGTFISGSNATNGLSVVVPANATKCSINFATESEAITPSTVGNISIYINNSIDSLKNDLVVKPVYVPSNAAFGTVSDNASYVSGKICILSFKFTTSSLCTKHSPIVPNGIKYFSNTGEVLKPLGKSFLTTNKYNNGFYVTTDGNIYVGDEDVPSGTTLYVTGSFMIE